MKSDYSKQVKRFQESIGLLNLGDEIIDAERRRLKKLNASKPNKNIIKRKS